MNLDRFVKLALEHGKQERALSAVDTARPYAQKALGGSITGLWTGMNVNKLRGVGPGHRALPIALAALGGILGISDEQLRRMARHPKYKTVLKETRREA